MRDELPRTFPDFSALKAFHTSGAASFHETRLHAAFSSSGHGELDQCRCCGRVPAMASFPYYSDHQFPGRGRLVPGRLLVIGKKIGRDVFASKRIQRRPWLSASRGKSPVLSYSLGKWPAQLAMVDDCRRRLRPEPNADMLATYCGPRVGTNAQS